MSELFPHSDETGITETRNDVEIVAYDMNGARYCVECARKMDKIECERFHEKPRSVPCGGSVQRRHMQQTDHTYHCLNTDCGKEIPV
jgi:hypothetical protein